MQVETVENPWNRFLSRSWPETQKSPPPVKGAGSCLGGANLCAAVLRFRFKTSRRSCKCGSLGPLAVVVPFSLPVRANTASRTTVRVSPCPLMRFRDRAGRPPGLPARPASPRWREAATTLYATNRGTKKEPRRRRTGQRGKSGMKRPRGRYPTDGRMSDRLIGEIPVEDPAHAGAKDAVIPVILNRDVDQLRADALLAGMAGA